MCGAIPKHVESLKLVSRRGTTASCTVLDISSKEFKQESKGYYVATAGHLFTDRAMPFYNFAIHSKKGMVEFKARDVMFDGLDPEICLIKVSREEVDELGISPSSVSIEDCLDAWECTWRSTGHHIDR